MYPILVTETPCLVAMTVHAGEIFSLAQAHFLTRRRYFVFPSSPLRRLDQGRENSLSYRATSYTPSRNRGLPFQKRYVYSHPVAHMATGFGDSNIRWQKASRLICGMPLHAISYSMVAVRGRPSSLPVFVRSYTGSPTCVQLPPFVWRQIGGFNPSKRTDLRMNQYIALTSNDSATPALFVDTTVPLEILLDAATYRLRAVTQVLENLALRSEISSDAVVLSDFALLCSIPLRDGCDLLDVIGRRMDVPCA